MRVGSVFIAAAVGMIFAMSVPAYSQERYTPGSTQSYPSDTWVRVGYDYNNDGYVDRWENVLASDLDRLHRQMGNTGVMYTERMGTMRQSQSMVSGSVRDLKHMDLAGLHEDHLLGKVHGSDGRVVHVDFGPGSNTDRFNLKDGDRITVYGRSGTINDRPMLMAERIEMGGQTLSVQLPHDRQMAPYSGRILSVKTASFENRNMPEQVFARVRLDNGATTAVNLGPKKQLGDVDFGRLEGKRLSFLAHPAVVGGERALVADELRVDGRMITIDWSA